MARAALIRDDRVVRLAEVDPERIPPHLADWRLVDDACAVGWIKDAEGNVVAPPPPTPAEIEAEQDARAETETARVVDQDVKLRAVVLALVDVVEQATGRQIPLTAVRDRVKHHIKAQIT